MGSIRNSCDVSSIYAVHTPTNTQTTGRYDEAETAYRTAKRLLPRPQPGKKLVTRIAPNSLSLFLNLGNLVARNRSRLEEADALYR